MPLLDAAIAFSLTMLAVATAVSVLIEIGQSFASLRRKTLKKFLQQFYVNELQPALASGVAQAEARANKSIAAAIDPLVQSLQTSLAGGADSAKGANGHLPPAKGKSLSGNGEVDTYQLVEVSTHEMIDRLRQSELGHKIVAELKEEADTVFEAVAERYERFGEIFSESFRKNRQAASVIISIVVAFAVNIDAIHLMKAYMLSSDTRDAVIAEASEILAASETTEAPDPNSADSLEQAASAAIDRLNALEASPFPIGQSQFPGCAAGSGDPRCGQVTNALGGARQAAAASIGDRISAAPQLYLTWLAGCLLTGLLAGLGAPFWYNAATSLMSASSRVRGSRQRLVGQLNVPQSDEAEPAQQSPAPGGQQAAGA